MIDELFMRKGQGEGEEAGWITVSFAEKKQNINMRKESPDKNKAK